MKSSRTLVATYLGMASACLALHGNPARGQALPFSEPRFFQSDVGAWNMVVYDFDGDGIEDVAPVDGGLGRVHLGDGQQGLSPGPGFATYFANSVAAGDLNEDGYGDLAWLGEGTQAFVTLSNGSAGFLLAQYLGPVAAWDSLMPIEIRDCDGDGHLDVAAAGGGWLGDSTGSFSPTFACAALAAQTGDFNRDGRSDRARLAIVGFYGEKGIRIALGTPGGQLGAEFNGPLVPNNARLMRAGDVNGDGADDLVLSIPGPGELGVAVANGSGSFEAPVFEPYPEVAKDLAIADIDADGHLEFAVASVLASRARFFRGTPDGRLTEYASLDLPAPPYGFALARLSRNGSPALVTSDGSALGLWVYPNLPRFSVEIPALSPLGLVLLGGLLAVAGAFALRRRRSADSLR